MDNIINLPFGEGNEIFISEINITQNIPDRELREKGNLHYRLQYYSDGFSIDAKVQDGTGNIYRFIENLKSMHTNLSSAVYWHNSTFTIVSD
jgi:hypothetical protein